MRVLVQNTLTNRQWIGFDSPSGFTVGRDDACDVKLDSRFISSVHARVERHDGNWEIELLPGVNSVQIDDKEHTAGQKAIIRGQARMRMMEFVLTLVDTDTTADRTAAEDGLIELQNTL